VRRAGVGSEFNGQRLGLSGHASEAKPKVGRRRAAGHTQGRRVGWVRSQRHCGRRTPKQERTQPARRPPPQLPPP